MNRTMIPLAELQLAPFSAWEPGWFVLTAGENRPGGFNSMTVSWGALGVIWGRPLAIVVVRPQTPHSSVYRQLRHIQLVRLRRGPSTSAQHARHALRTRLTQDDRLRADFGRAARHHLPRLRRGQADSGLPQDVFRRPGARNTSWPTSLPRTTKATTTACILVRFCSPPAHPSTAAIREHAFTTPGASGALSEPRAQPTAPRYNRP